MNSRCYKPVFFHITVLILILSAILYAQQRELVWAEEFDNNEIDLSVWDYETGPSNDNLHYYTTRSENVRIVDGILNIVALEESYSGFNYTSGLIRTKIGWGYGRIEARIKVPGSKGFVPAFWMLPTDNIYGWWPKSGEIDIMEHPSNEISNIYGSIHTETYNNFGGIGNEGDVTVVADAETAFHVYAVEWNENKIDFFVDDNLYYTFTNEQKGSASWPFDQPFYIILNLAVGGGWVGNPDETTVFPAVMEVDWVRVYQYVGDIKISGTEYVPYNSKDVIYSIPPIEGASYNWEVPGNADINTNLDSHQISVNWGLFGGDIKTYVATKEANFIYYQPVNVSDNLLKNGAFETGVKYWSSHVGQPAAADFNLINQDTLYGTKALSVDVQTLASNPWDIQTSQGNILLKRDQEYQLSFWAKASNSDAQVSLTFINDAFYVYKSETFPLSDEWNQYEFNYTATADDQVSLNIDMGTHTGNYYFDHFLLTTTQLSAINQIHNADFFNGKDNWNLTTLSTAQASDSVIDGTYTVSISNGGSQVWDIHAGQFPVNIQNGKEYQITFDAWASQARTISALVGINSSPWTVYHDNQVFSLSTEKQTFSYSFIMNYPSDAQSRFGFDIGGESGKVFFDNIQVNSGTTPVNTIPGTTKHPDKIHLFQNYPNPFNPKTTINYYLPETGYVELSVYNLLGQKVKMLTSDKKAAGNHKVDFYSGNLTSGVYIYQLQVNNRFVRSMKLVIIK